VLISILGGSSVGEPVLVVQGRVAGQEHQAVSVVLSSQVIVYHFKVLDLMTMVFVVEALEV
jgi:hypothetical protein